MGTSRIAFERAQALLKVDTGSGSLYDHLVRVVRKLGEDKPADALEHLETLSRHLKQTTFRGDAGPDDSTAVSVDRAAENLRLQWCTEAVQLVRAPSDPTATPKVLAAVQNYMEDAAMFAWAGVGFGNQESFHIAMSLRKLASETTALDSLRLWGKIFGTDGDYYVAEGMLTSYGAPSGPDPVVKAAKALAAAALANKRMGYYDVERPPPPIVLPGTDYDVEPRGCGPNIAAYWVSAGGNAPWVRLPAARASTIVAARNMQRLMTGSLESPVISSPWFPGDERDLLRAQIARIASTCTLAVTNWFKLTEAENDTTPAPSKKLVVDVDEENSEPVCTFGDLDLPATWVHAMPYLMNNGRSDYGREALDQAQGEETTKLFANENEYATLTEALDKEQSFDEPKPMEAVIAAAIDGDEIKFMGDLKLEEPDADDPMQKTWSIKVCGDKGLYADDVSHKVVAVRSRTWPGAVSVASAERKKYANLYVGYALKCGTLVPRHKDSGLPLRGTCPITPMEPDDVMELYEQNPNPQDEFNEPNPQEVEPESDEGQDVDED